MNGITLCLQVLTLHKFTIKIKHHVSILVSKFIYPSSKVEEKVKRARKPALEKWLSDGVPAQLLGAQGFIPNATQTRGSGEMEGTQHTEV